MKTVSNDWISTGRTIYTTVTDPRSRHPEQRQAILSIAEGWSDKEAADLCNRILAMPTMLAALEYTYKRIITDNAYVGDPLIAVVFSAIAAAKGESHAPDSTD